MGTTAGSVLVLILGAAIAKAEAAGATLVMPAADMFWGDRYGKLEDAFGHHWSVATHVRDVSLEEAQKAMQAMQQQGG